MNHHHKPNLLQTHHKLLPAHTGVTRCLAQPPWGSTTTTSQQHPPIWAPCTTAPALNSSLVSDHTRVSHAHTRPLHPAALAFVPYGVVLVRVRVQGPGSGSGLGLGLLPQLFPLPSEPKASLLLTVTPEGACIMRKRTPGAVFTPVCDGLAGTSTSGAVFSRE